MPSTQPSPHTLPKRSGRRNATPPRTDRDDAAIEPAIPEANDPVDYGTEDVVTKSDGTKAYRLRYKLDQGETRYLIVENDFRDRGGIPGLLTYTAEAGNRLTIEQRLDNAGRRTPRRPGTPGVPAQLVSPHDSIIEWRIDRFEAREKALGEESKFDSLRDTYPVAALRRLGASNGAKATFERDGWTGIAKRIRIQPGRVTGPATRRKLSKTTQKCLFDNNNLADLLDAVGPLILPRTPRAVGETWTQTRDKEIRNFGKSVTTYQLTLDRVDEQPEDHLIAHVSIKGGIRLVPDPQPANPTTSDEDSPAATQPANRVHRRRQQPNPQKHHDFKLDSETVAGEYTFDISHGMLLNLTLRRDSALSADMHSDEMGDLSLESAESHMLRVKTSTSEPPKPLIVGGPKPPKDDPSDLVRPPRPTVKKKSPPRVRSLAEQRENRAQDYAERQRLARERLQKRREQMEKMRQEAMRRRGITTQPATSQPVWPPRDDADQDQSGSEKQPASQPVQPRPRPVTPQPTTQPAEVHN